MYDSQDFQRCPFLKLKHLQCRSHAYHTLVLLGSSVVAGSIGVTGVFTWEAVVGQLTAGHCVTHIAILTQPTAVTPLQ